MRTTFVCLAGMLLLAACSKAPPAAQSADITGPTAAAPSQPAAPPAFSPDAAVSAPVSGSYIGNGKAATLTAVTAHKDDPFDGQPVTALVFTAKDQGGDDKAATDAVFGKFGDAVVARIEPDGTVIGVDVLHSGLKDPERSISISGVLTVKDYKASGGWISGELTSGGPTDVFDQKVDVDLTFHVKAP